MKIEIESDMEYEDPSKIPESVAEVRDEERSNWWEIFI